MNKTNIILLLLAISMVVAVQIESGDRIYSIDCHNTSGSLVGTTGTITCRDSSGNVDVNAEALVNYATGKFYYVFAEADDRYGCDINCGDASAIDYGIPVAQGQLLQTSDNIGLNLDDTSGDYESADFEDSFLTAAKIATSAIGADEIASSAIGANEIAANAIGSSELASAAITADHIAASAINSDKIALNAIGAAQIAADAITSSEIAADAIGASEAGFLTDSTGFQGADIAATLADTTELQANQSNFKTAKGFSTHTAANVWAVGTRTLTSYGTLVADIWAKVRQAYTVAFTYDGSGFPNIDTYSYSDGTNVTETWTISSVNTTITNKTVVVS